LEKSLSQEYSATADVNKWQISRPRSMHNTKVGFVIFTQNSCYFCCS